jgi:signal transduction histidine kinase
MIRVLGCITEQHEPWLVGVAAILCAFGCYTTLSVLARARIDPTGRGDRGWLAAAAITGGATIWTTHFVAMLAYHPGFAVGYDIPLTALSILFAVTITWIGFALALHVHPVLGGAVFGAAVGAMHYTGMSALSVPADFHWDPAYVVASVAIGILFGIAALYIFTHRDALRWRIVAAGLMVLAIAGHHFTAMSALTLRLDPVVGVTSGAVLAPTWLAIVVAVVMMMVASLGLAGSVVDQHLAQRQADEAVRLHAHIGALEAAKADLADALRQAAAASEAKSRFLATMSHELRTPLNAIIGFSDIMRTELYGPHSDARYRVYSEDVHRSGGHLLQLINDILDFSKIEVDQLTLKDDLFDPRDAVAEALRTMRAQADAAGVTLSWDASSWEASDVPLLRGDERRVRQVLLNLLSNAIKFTPSGGAARIVVSPDGRDLVIAVADNGIGIAPGDIAHTFEPFRQIDNRLARKYDGTGLGLPLSQRLMALHGGALEIESALDRGTTVTMRFPAERLVALAPAAFADA